ncbi:MAG: HAD hydrolase-like protein [Lachnospiraceae bacterium]
MCLSQKRSESQNRRENFFETAFEQLNENRTEKISSAETMIIGDSLTSDMAGGLQYGMKTCYYRRNSERAMPEQKMGRIDFVIDHLDQVADYI